MAAYGAIRWHRLRYERKMILMATFAAWLATQQGKQDDIGKLARAWAADRGKGTIRSPEGMKRYIREVWPEDEADYWVATIAAAQQQYDREREAGRSLSPDEEQNWREQLDGQQQGLPATGDVQERAAPGGDNLDRAFRTATGREPPPRPDRDELLRAAGTRLDAVAIEQARAGHDLDVIKSRLAFLVAGMAVLLPDSVLSDLLPLLDDDLRARPEDAELTEMAAAADFSGP